MDKPLSQLLLDIHSFDKEKRRTAVIKLGLIGGDEAIRALIVTVNNDHEDTIARGKAALMLGKLRDLRAVPALIHALSASGFKTPIFAAEALGKIGDRRAIRQLLIEIEFRPNDETFQKAASEALRRLGHNEIELV